METNFILAGFGGQGILLAGTVLANAFMLEGEKCNLVSMLRCRDEGWNCKL